MHDFDLQTLVKEFENDDRLIFWEAAKSLGLSRREEAFTPLLRGLSSPAENKRAAAAYALGCLRDKRAGAPLLELFRKEESDMVRDHIAESLANFPSSEVIDTLTLALEDTSEKVRFSAAHALEHIKSPPYP